MKISADCLRHHIYEHDVEAITQAIQIDDRIFCNYLLSDVGLTRGYMFAKSVDVGKTLKRKSPLTVTDAIQTNNNRSNLMEVGSTTGARTDTSFFTVEKIGDVEYVAKGLIDLKTLAFISADDRSDRMAIESKWCDNGLVDDILKLHYGTNAQYEIGYFTTSAKYITNTFAEFGILLGDEIVSNLVKHILTNILKLDIRRNTAWTKCAKLEIKLVNDLIESKFDDEGWIDVNSENDINTLQITYGTLYSRATNEDLAKQREVDEKFKAIEERRLYDKNQLREENVRKREEKKLKKQKEENNE